MKQVLVASSMALASQLGFSLKVPASLLEVQLGAGDCFSHTCSDGYVPKSDHHEITGSSDAECCQPTCQLWSCTGTYVSNDAYKGNIGSSNQQCCDKTCAAMTCPKGQKVPLDLKDTAGVSAKDCCKDTCASVMCEPFHNPVRANKNSVYPEGEEQSFCCEPTCGAYTCDYRKGLTLDKAKREVSGVNDETCCVPTCSKTSCPSGFKTRPENVNKDAREVECCEPLCKSHTCSAGWVPDESKEDHVGNTDEECCQPTCKLYTCSETWAANPATASNVGIDDETCCSKTCAQYQDKCVGDYAKNNATLQTVGQTAEKCCSKTCALHTCGTGVNIPNAKSVVASSDELCCEDSRCPALRNMTKVEGNNGCNPLPKDECNKKYVELEDRRTNETVIFACEWHVVAMDQGLCGTAYQAQPDCAGVTASAL